LITDVINDKTNMPCFLSSIFIDTVLSTLNLPTLT